MPFSHFDRRHCCRVFTFVQYIYKLGFCDVNMYSYTVSQQCLGCVKDWLNGAVHHFYIVKAQQLIFS